MRSRSVRLLTKRHVLPPSEVRPMRPPVISKLPPAIQPCRASVNQTSRKSALVPSGSASQVRFPHPAAVVSTTQTATAARLMPVVSASQR
jgi:hypothetical protein